MVAKTERNPPITVLIDGPDLCGKSSLSQALYDKISAQGISVDRFKGRVLVNRLHTFLDRFDANRWHGSALLNSLYIIAAIFDHGFGKSSCDVLICESHIDRVIAYGLACRLHSLARPALAFRRAFRRFDLPVLLSAPSEVRLARLKTRLGATKIDVKTTLDLELSEAFASSFKETFSRAGDFVTYDTAQFDVDYISNDIFYRLQVVRDQNENTSAAGH